MRNLTNSLIGFSCLDKLYGSPRYAMLFSYDGLASIIASYNFYLFIRKYSLVSAFAVSIKNIFYLSSEKKVPRVDTGGDVATMKYVETLWNRTTVNFPRKTMGMNSSTFNTYRSISILKPTSAPKPTTRIGFWYNIFFKTPPNWDNGTLREAHRATILSIRSISLIHKWLFTYETYKDFFHTDYSIKSEISCQF